MPSFLLTIEIDVLSRMLLRVEENRLLEGFLMGTSRTKASHLQFVDNTIFFSRTCSKNLQNLKLILLVVKHISGLKINLDKSTLFGINMSQDQMLLDCKVPN